MSVRLANLAGRAVLVTADGVLDVARGSAGRLPADPMAVLERWDVLRDFAAGLPAGRADGPLDEAKLGPCAPHPPKVFGIGLNYRAHAEESGMDLPESPLVFTKFPSCIAGPRDAVVLSSDRVDWEVELVVVIGRAGRRIPEGRARDHVAGYCVGQDISDRGVQFAGRPPQFSMGKSFDTFGPIGPAIVSLDAFADPDDLALTCDVSGKRMQEARTNDLIFSVPALVSRLSAVCTLAPGDLIFTGTPSGVGAMQKPPRFLAADDEIVSTIEGIGTLVNRCVAG